jgi:3',5'-cyclic-AMP phosphodiesterase
VNELVWLSDLHADGLQSDFSAHVEGLRQQAPEGILITGDISNATQLEEHLMILAKLSCPIFFVLGNHDFWNGSFAGVTSLVRSVCSRNSNLFFLERHGLVPLGEGVVMMGCQGWGDGRAGLGEKSPVTSRDRDSIKDFANKPRERYFEQLRSLGQASVAGLPKQARSAFERADHLILATHVPPFVPSALRTPEQLPYYVNMALGRRILGIARRFPGKRISVYCGHTHRSCTYQPLPNVIVRVAEATNGIFQIAGRIRLNEG